MRNTRVRLAGAALLLALALLAQAAFAQRPGRQRPWWKRGRPERPGPDAPAAPARSETALSDKVNAAVDRAGRYILSRQANDGSWSEGGRGFGRIGVRQGDQNPCGSTALALIALHSCGVSPRNEAWVRGAKWLMEQDQPNTYGRALRIIALSIIAAVDDNYVKYLTKDTNELIAGMRANGGWRYPVADDGNTDNSNSQYAVLALREAAYARAEVSDRVWKKLVEYWQDVQNADGGWGYGPQRTGGLGDRLGGRLGRDNDDSYGSMSAAGLASAYIVYDMYITRTRGSTPTCRDLGEFKPIVNGLKWFDENFSATTNPGRGGGAFGRGSDQWYYYYLYNLERVGATSGRKYFGRHDWYKDVAAKLLADQFADGQLARAFYDHCYATIFLAKARAQVVMNKLESGGLDWDVHTRDVANLTRDMVRRFERPLNWQIVDLKRDVRELHDAPVLFLTGSKAPKFSAEDEAKLRQFVFEGGTIFAQAACGSAAFAAGFRTLCERILPEYELRPLAKDHPVFSAHARLDGRTLLGIDNGVRVCVFFSPADVSFYWHRWMPETRKYEFELGANIVVYAMDRAGFRTKTSQPVLGDVVAARKISAGLVRHAAGWNANPLCLNRLSDAMARQAGVGLDVRPAVNLAGESLAGIRLLWISGYKALDLPAEQKRALRAYLESGGLLIADAAGGNADFYASVRDLVRELLPAATLRAATTADAVLSGRLPVSGGHDVTKVDYRRVLRVEGMAEKPPELELVLVGNRVAAILSCYDIASGIQGQTPYNCRGYDIESSRRIAVNLALLADGRER